MGLRDFFSFGRKKASRQKGLRRAATPGRAPGDRTAQIGPRREVVAAPPLPPPPASPAPTVVAPRSVRAGAGALASAPAPPPYEPVAPLPRAPAPAPAPPRPAQPGDAPTQYVRVADASDHEVVGVLVAVKGELKGAVYRVFDGENRLGRAHDCEVELASTEVSRLHAKIVHQNGCFAIAPLSDRNPTLVNDEPTQGAELADGDYVKLGSITLRFRTVV